MGGHQGDAAPQRTHKEAGGDGGGSLGRTLDTSEGGRRADGERGGVPQDVGPTHQTAAHLHAAFKVMVAGHGYLTRPSSFTFR